MMKTMSFSENYHPETSRSAPRRESTTNGSTRGLAKMTTSTRVLDEFQAGFLWVLMGFFWNCHQGLLRTKRKWMGSLLGIIFHSKMYNNEHHERKKITGNYGNVWNPRKWGKKWWWDETWWFPYHWCPLNSHWLMIIGVCVYKAL